MINECEDCRAIREYPSGRLIEICPRCGSTKIVHYNSPETQEERDKFLLDCIIGKEPNAPK